MLEFFQFALRNFWTFIGVIILITLLGRIFIIAVVGVAVALKGGDIDL